MHPLRAALLIAIGEWQPTLQAIVSLTASNYLPCHLRRFLGITFASPCFVLHHFSVGLLICSERWVSVKHYSGANLSLLRNHWWLEMKPIVRSIDLDEFPDKWNSKRLQETIMEMTQNPDIVAAALRHIGPPADANPVGWPSTNWVDAIAGSKVTC